MIMNYKNKYISFKNEIDKMLEVIKGINISESGHLIDMDYFSLENILKRKKEEENNLDKLIENYLNTKDYVH